MQTLSASERTKAFAPRGIGCGEGSGGNPAHRRDTDRTARRSAASGRRRALELAVHGVDVDVSLAWLPFELQAIAAADRIDLGGVVIPVARAEDLIIYEAVAFRPLDQQDIERLLTLHGKQVKQVDLARIRRTIAEFAEAMDEPERLAAFDRIAKGIAE